MRPEFIVGECGDSLALMAAQGSLDGHIGKSVDDFRDGGAGRTIQPDNPFFAREQRREIGNRGAAGMNGEVECLFLGDCRLQPVHPAANINAGDLEGHIGRVEYLCGQTRWRKGGDERHCGGLRPAWRPVAPPE